MARTIQQIYDDMIEIKDLSGPLSGLQPASDTFINLMSALNSRAKVAIWRLIFYIVAVAIHTHEVFVEVLIARYRPGTIPWYREKCLEFQLGDPLLYQSGVYVYSLINESNRIVTHAVAIEKANGTLLIKVAKGTSPTLSPLTTTEKNAFLAYFHLIKFAGTIVELVSENADVVKLSYRVFYDPLLIASDGTSVLNPSEKPVHNGINIFLAELSFGGVLRLEELDQAIRSIPGVKNIVRVSAYAKYGVLPYSNIETTYNHSYEPFAGYMKVSDTAGETLDDLLIFVPNA